MPRQSQSPSGLATIMVAICAIVAACAPQPLAGSGSGIIQQGPQPASAGGGNFDAGQGAPPSLQTGADGQIQDKTLVIGIATEVRGFSPLNDLQNKYVEDLVLGNLFIQDEQGRWSPALAAEAPSLDRGTWKLNSDGTSETIYRLRQGVKWHDGVEFTVHDLIFFWRVGWDDEIPWAHDRVRDIKHMEALDNYTLKTAWGIWEAEADAIDLRMMWPLPRHILEETYNADKLRFINHPYWTTEFVGLGPYRLARFEHGSHLELVANDDYILGRPRIKHVQVRFFQDANVLISALLGGDAHLTLHGSGREGGLSMSDGITLGLRSNVGGINRVPPKNRGRLGMHAHTWTIQ